MGRESHVSYPHFPIVIRLTVAAPQTQNDIQMELSRLLPFAPYSGVKLRLWCEDETLDLDITEPVYSFQDSAFVVELEYTTAQDSFRNSEGSTVQELVAMYTNFGFKRMNYPTGQVIRREHG